MIHKGADLSFVDAEGYSPLLTAIESSCAAKFEMIELLLKNGAPTDVHGVNDWTPLHLAAARNDVESLKLLIKFGADVTARTRIDDYATPLEEAQKLGSEAAVTFLKGVA
jgi:ankyrin repeat protein